MSLDFAPLDVGVVVAFLLAIGALGFSARLRDNSVLQFLAAGRSLTLPAFVATLVCTWYGGILGIGESVSFYGAGTWLLFGVPYYVFAAIYAIWFAERVRGADQISIPERLASRWGKGAGVASGVLIFLLAVPAAHVLMLGVMVRLLTGWDPAVSAAFAAIGGSLFLYKGGLLADVRVSLLAFVAMYAGFGMIAAWCATRMPPAQMWAALQEPMRRIDGGAGPIVVASFFVLGAWTLVDPGFHQRVASAETPRTGRRGVWASIGFWLLFDVLTITTGLYAMAMMSPLPPGLEVFPRFADQTLPPGLKGLFFCGLLGTILSAMVGYTLVAGSSFGRDVVARLGSVSDDAKVKRWARVGMALATMAAILLAVGIKSVVNLWYAWGGCVVGAMLIPVASAYLSPRTRISGGWIMTSLLAAFGASFAWMEFALHTGNPFFEVFWLDGGLRLVPPSGGVPTLRIAVGTLAPALVISAAVLAVGALRGTRTDDRRPDPA